MRMHNSPHPGEIIKQLCLEPLRISVAETSQALVINRKTLSAILMVGQGLASKWPFACPSPSAHRQKAG